MHALVFDSVREIRFVTDAPRPRLRSPGDVVVRVTLCAICGSDLHPFRGDERGIARGTGECASSLARRRAARIAASGCLYTLHALGRCAARQLAVSLGSAPLGENVLADTHSLEHIRTALVTSSRWA